MSARPSAARGGVPVRPRPLPRRPWSRARPWLGIGLLAAPGLLGALGCSDGARPRANGPDILVISLDTVRADDLTFLDPTWAPRMTELARRGTVFTQAVSGSSWTLPTHVQLLTGQPPSVHRVETDDVSMDTRTPTLPELLKEAGWFTAGFWSGWYLAPEFGFGRGFLTYQNAMTDADLLDGQFRERFDSDKIPDVWQAVGTREKQSHEDVTSERLAELAGEVLSSLDGDEPVFFFAHFYDPHYDYIPPGDWGTVLDPDYRGTIDGRDFWINPRVWDWRTRKRVIGDRDLQHIRALYRGEIGWTDRWVGEILDQFERAGRLDDLLIVITSDHGEEFFEHQNRGHRQTLFDESIRVPLLVVPPGAVAADAPVQVAAQVSLSDVTPTVLDYVGLDTPASVFGRSLRPALEGATLETRPVVSSMQLYEADAETHTWKAYLWESLRYPDRKLMRITTVGADGEPQVTSVAYYDLLGDPGEQRGIVGSPAQVGADPRVRAMWGELEGQIASMRERAGTLPHQDPEERTTNMAKLLESELRGLGYVDVESEGVDTPGRLVPWGLGVRPAQPLE